MSRFSEPELFTEMRARRQRVRFAFALALLAAGGGDDAPDSRGNAGAAGAITPPGGGGSGASAGSSATGGHSASGGGSGGAASGASSGGAAAGGGAGGGGAGNGGQGGGAAGGNAGSDGSGGAPMSGVFKGVANSDCADLTRLGATWWYNWVTSPGSCKANEFVPMIAGKAEKTPEAVTAALTKIKAAGYRTVLGFNEPNKTDQANLSLESVVGMWPALTADPEMRVGSPATSADAKQWFEDFMAQVDAKGLRVDFVAIHWYGWNAGSCNDAKELEAYITWAEQFERPIWITEFGCLNASNSSAEVVQGFYASALQAFGRHPSVERYAWYPWTANNELVLSGDLTALGNAFAAAPKTR
jgi:Glycosyl hydrolase catalytic core